MNELLGRALEGVDFGSPDAGWQLFLNLMGMMPWKLMIAYTVVTVVIGLFIAWYRRSSYIMAVVWALLIGPAGWLISWHAVPQPRKCPRCGNSNDRKSRRCTSCGCHLASARQHSANPPAS